MKDDIVRTILKTKIIAIIRGLEPEDSLRLVQSWQKAGIRLAEVAFDPSRPERDQTVLKTIELLCRQTKGSMIIGAGTVISEEKLKAAHKSGAAFMVAPNVNKKIIKKANQLDMVTLPGAFSPTEMEKAYEAGADFVKVFPASVLTPAYIRAVTNSLSQIPLVAVGGVSSQNAGDFLKAGCCAVGVGGRLANKDMIRQGQWNQIEQEAVDLVNAVGNAER
jgi:2-dehydro-3-deoxyphosphogluconate aldolase/(4S)-4-hydroxy-2-oxoglutarate aldolase